MAERIISATGGKGAILSFNKKDGVWVGTPVRGEPLVLIADWSKESSIDDSGFTEGAAVKFFSGLVTLDNQLGKQLLTSPLHFIGHGRGAVVNTRSFNGWGCIFPM